MPSWASNVARADIDEIVRDGPEEDDAPPTDQAITACTGVSYLIDLEPQRGLRVVVFSTGDGGLNLIIDRPDGEARLSFHFGSNGRIVCKRVFVSGCDVFPWWPLDEQFKWLRA